MFAPFSSRAVKTCGRWRGYKNLLWSKVRGFGVFKQVSKEGKTRLGRFMLLGQFCLARGKSRAQKQESVGKSKGELKERSVKSLAVCVEIINRSVFFRYILGVDVEVGD